MKPNLVLFCLLVFGVVGCASTSQSGAGGSMAKPKKAQFGDTEESVAKDEDVKKKTPMVYAQPIETVREAGLRALTFVGCKITVQRPYFLEGERPRKFGLFIGSGGETVKVFILPRGNDVHAWVDTDLNFVGIAGQQDWEKQVTEEMQRILKAPAK